MDWAVAVTVAAVACIVGGTVTVFVWMRCQRRRYHAGPRQDTDSETGDVVPSPPVKCTEQHVYVMRHAEREDDVNPMWAAGAERPCDTPISKAGAEAAQAAGRALQDAGVAVVVASPFFRCVQTAINVCKGMGFEDEIFIDYGLSEVHSTDVIKGADPLQPVALTAAELAAHFPGRVCPNAGTIAMPQWGEERGIGGGAYIRYITAMARLAERHRGRHVLLVTHGDAIAACVGNVLPPGSMVYRTDYCCCAHFVRHCDDWELLSESGSGIEWIAD